MTWNWACSKNTIDVVQRFVNDATRLRTRTQTNGLSLIRELERNSRSMSMAQVGNDEEPQSNWREYIKGVRNVPPLFKMVWKAAPGVVASSIFLRLLAALIPLTMLAVTKLIIDSIYNL